MKRRLGVRFGCMVLALVSLGACDSATPGSRTQVETGPTARAGGAVRAGQPLAGRVIVLDPGHNGGGAAHPEVINQLVDAYTQMKPCNTTGTKTVDGYPEHAFTWDVAQRLAARLRGAGASVVLTRPDDTGVGPCVTERAAIGNRSRAAVVLSIHGDAAGAADHGFHVMEPAAIPGAPSGPIVAGSHRFALAVRDQLRAIQAPATYVGVDGIDARTDMAGLNLSVVPVVMVECGNMRNAADAARMRDPDFRRQLADALAGGIEAYLSN